MYRCGDGADDEGPPGAILGGFSFTGGLGADGAASARHPAININSIPAPIARLRALAIRADSQKIGTVGPRRRWARPLTVGAHKCLSWNVCCCTTRFTGVIRWPGGRLSRTPAASYSVDGCIASLRPGCRKRRYPLSLTLRRAERVA